MRETLLVYARRVVNAAWTACVRIREYGLSV